MRIPSVLVYICAKHSDARTRRFSDAERDCTTTLALSHGNIKALFRRAQARVALRKLDEAGKGALALSSRCGARADCDLSDLNEVLKKDPNNEPAKQELSSLIKLREEIKASKKVLYCAEHLVCSLTACITDTDLSHTTNSRTTFRAGREASPETCQAPYSHRDCGGRPADSAGCNNFSFCRTNWRLAL